MDEPIYTAADRHRFHPTSCPECGKPRELGWVNVGSTADMDQWSPNQKCRNRQCGLFRDPTSLG